MPVVLCFFSRRPFQNLTFCIVTPGTTKVAHVAKIILLLRLKHCLWVMCTKKSHVFPRSKFPSFCCLRNGNRKWWKLFLVGTPSYWVNGTRFTWVSMLMFTTSYSWESLWCEGAKYTILHLKEYMNSPCEVSFQIQIILILIEYKIAF